MRSLLLITSKGFDRNVFDVALKEMGQKFHYMDNGKRLFVENGEQYCALEDYGGISDGGVYYEEGELDGVELDEPHFFSLEFRSLEFIRPVLGCLLDREDVWIDNDRSLMRGVDFVERLKSDPLWDFNYEI